MNHEISITKGKFYDYTGMSRRACESVWQENPDCLNEDNQVNVFAFIRTLNKKLTSVNAIAGGKNDTEETKLSIQIEYEKLLKLRMQNQNLLKQLLPIEEVIDRQVKFLYAFVNIITHAIQLASPKFPGKKRDNEIILTDAFNSAQKFLFDNADLTDYNQDGDLYVTKTRLAKIEELEATEEARQKEREIEFERRANETKN